eukprot:jgi/Ulvmu1/3893/UM018_0114.1
MQAHSCRTQACASGTACSRACTGQAAVTHARTAQPWAREFVSEGPVSKLHGQVKSRYHVCSMPSETAAALMSVDRAVYAAVASSLLTFVMSHMAWKINSGNESQETPDSPMPSMTSMTSSSTTARPGSQRGQIRSSQLSRVDGNSIQEEDIWEVARSGLIDGGTKPASTSKGDESIGQQASWLPQWHLQGLHKQGRAAIITASMQSVHKLLCSAPASIAAAPASVLEVAAVAAVAVAACDAFAATMGYVPSELLNATLAPLQQLRSELDAYGDEHAKDDSTGATGGAAFDSDDVDQPQNELRLSQSSVALDTTGPARDTVAWLQESLQASGPACAAAGASVLQPQAYDSKRSPSGRTAERRESWKAGRGATTLPGINSGKATAHAMLIRCLLQCRLDAASARDGGAAAVPPPPPSKVIRNLPALLQDMALCTAEAAAAVYMSDVRNGSLGTGAVWGWESQPEAGRAPQARRGRGSRRGVGDGGHRVVREENRSYEEVSVPALLHPRLATTRELERFRNHVAIAAMLRRSYGRVRDVYEDRYTLQGVQDGHRLIARQLYVRRARELNSLAGWQVRLSTAMEIGDVVAPLVSRLLARLSRFVSWLLVSLVGGGLGLIYKGIRQSLRGGGAAGGGRTADGAGQRRRSSVGEDRGHGDADEDAFFHGFA